MFCNRESSNTACKYLINHQDHHYLFLYYVYSKVKPGEATQIRCPSHLFYTFICIGITIIVPYCNCNSLHYILYIMIENLNCKCRVSLSAQPKVLYDERYVTFSVLRRQINLIQFGF
jgi:hypothetical protein